MACIHCLIISLSPAKDTKKIGGYLEDVTKALAQIGAVYAKPGEEYGLIEAVVSMLRGEYAEALKTVGEVKAGHTHTH